MLSWLFPKSKPVKKPSAWSVTFTPQPANRLYIGLSESDISTLLDTPNGRVCKPDLKDGVQRWVTLKDILAGQFTFVSFGGFSESMLVTLIVGCGSPPMYNISKLSTEEIRIACRYFSLFRVEGVFMHVDAENHRGNHILMNAVMNGDVHSDELNWCDNNGIFHFEQIVPGRAKVDIQALITSPRLCVSKLVLTYIDSPGRAEIRELFRTSWLHSIFACIEDSGFGQGGERIITIKSETRTHIVTLIESRLPRNAKKSAISRMPIDLMRMLAGYFPMFEEMQHGYAPRD